MKVGGQLHATEALPTVTEPPVLTFDRGWVGPGVGLDAVAKRGNSIIALTSNRTPVAHYVAYLLCID
jgi:hypothetical protein